MAFRQFTTTNRYHILVFWVHFDFWPLRNKNQIYSNNLLQSGCFFEFTTLSFHVISNESLIVNVVIPNILPLGVIHKLRLWQWGERRS